jgi:predicted dehydrogenase
MTVDTPSSTLSVLTTWGKADLTMENIRMDTVAVGVLGAARGMSVGGLIDKLPNARVVAVCDRIEKRLQHGLSQTERATGFDDYEAMLREPIDAVVVASSPPDHARHVCMALEAGKAVLSEVPSAHTLEDAQQIIDTVEKTNGWYMFGENCNYYGYIRTWKRMIDEGILGEVVHAEGEYIHDIRHMTWNAPDGTCLTPQEAAKVPGSSKSWRNAYHPIRYITHTLGPLLWLMEDRCTSVSCLSTGCRTAPEIGSPDLEVAIMNTESGSPIRQLCGFSVPHKPGGQWFCVYTTKGCVEWKRSNDDSPKVYIEGQDVSDKIKADWDMSPGIGPLKDSGHGGIDGAMVWEFIEAFRNGQPSPIDVHAGMDYTLPGIYASMSAEQGGVRLDIPDTRVSRIV